MKRSPVPLPLPWGEASIEVGHTHELELGTLQLKVRRTETEIWLRAHRSPAGDPEQAPWQRWAVAATGQIEIRPALPNRLIVVSPEHEYHLPPQGVSRIFVRVPLFVQVAILEGDSEVVAADLPSIVLSDTWWGTFTEGEIAYWLETKARVDLSDDLFLPHLGMCTLTLTNDSPSALPVERFAVRAAHLSLFTDGARNWTDSVSVRYDDSPEGSEITFAGKAPAHAREAEVIARPRVRLEMSFHAKTFDRLRSLSNPGS